MLPASGNRYDEPFISLPFAYLLLSKLIVNALKRRHKMEFPRIEMGGRTAAVIGSIRDPPTPKKEAPFQHLSLNRGFPQGWVGFSPLPSL